MIHWYFGSGLPFWTTLYAFAGNGPPPQLFETVTFAENTTHHNANNIETSLYGVHDVLTSR